MSSQHSLLVKYAKYAKIFVFRAVTEETKHIGVGWGSSSGEPQSALFRLWFCPEASATEKKSRKEAGRL